MSDPYIDTAAVRVAFQRTEPLPGSLGERLCDEIDRLRAALDEPAPPAVNVPVAVPADSDCGACDGTGWFEYWDEGWYNAPCLACAPKEVTAAPALDGPE